MISYNEAIKIIEKEFELIPKEIVEIDLLDAEGYVLAEDIFADTNLPPFDHSGMDGFGIKFSDGVNQWKIIGELSAGNYKEIKIDEESAVRIMTGGKISPGIDTVIPIEDVEEKDGFVHKKESAKVKYGQNIRRKGEDLSENLLAVAKGKLLNPQNLTLASACGKLKIKVYKKLKIGILTTGDELVDIHIKPSEDKIRATNLYSIILLVKQSQMIPVNLGMVKDNKEQLKKRIKEALTSDIDLLITTGGVSVGKYDYLQDILKELGTEILFWRVFIKPGKPLLFGKYSKEGSTKLIFGLPGNPVSSFVNYIIFIKYGIQKFYGDDTKNVLIAELQTAIKKKDNKRHFFRGVLHFDETIDKYFVSESSHQSSGNIKGLSEADCLIVLTEDIINPNAGDKVKCIMI